MTLQAWWDAVKEILHPDAADFLYRGGGQDLVGFYPR